MNSSWDRNDLPEAKRARMAKYANYVPEEETIRNDYSQHYVDSGFYPQNYILGTHAGAASTAAGSGSGGNNNERLLQAGAEAQWGGGGERFEEYPKQRRLWELKKEAVEACACPPSWLEEGELEVLLRDLEIEEEEEEEPEPEPDVVVEPEPAPEPEPEPEPEPKVEVKKTPTPILTPAPAPAPAPTPTPKKEPTPAPENDLDARIGPWGDLDPFIKPTPGVSLEVRDRRLAPSSASPQPQPVPSLHPGQQQQRHGLPNPPHLSQSQSQVQPQGNSLQPPPSSLPVPTPTNLAHPLPTRPNIPAPSSSPIPLSTTITAQPIAQPIGVHPNSQGQMHGLNQIPTFMRNQSPAFSIPSMPPTPPTPGVRKLEMSSKGGEKAETVGSGPAKFDVILLTPPPGMPFFPPPDDDEDGEEEHADATSLISSPSKPSKSKASKNSKQKYRALSELPIPALASDPSFLFLWVSSSGPGNDLEQAREVMARWEYRRCEDVIWCVTNRRSGRGVGVSAFFFFFLFNLIFLFVPVLWRVRGQRWMGKLSRGLVPVSGIAPRLLSLVEQQVSCPFHYHGSRTPWWLDSI